MERSIDPEKHTHSIGLYKVWNSKVDLLKRTAEWNPFNTEFFFYFDVGGFRYKSLEPLI
jgi:hypothetical protein